MRNDGNNYKSEKIIQAVSSLPYFTIDTMRGYLAKDDHYLRMLLSRYSKSGKFVRLKKGLYTTKLFIDDLQKRDAHSSFLEFLATILYKPSYISLEYILYKYNILTELPVNVTSVTRNKTNTFHNSLGIFIYHKIKSSLFAGFRTARKDGFFVFEATKAKALFDFLYLRKNQIVNRESAEELRLNLDEFTESDRAELQKYIELEGSDKMKNIISFLFG